MNAQVIKKIVLAVAIVLLVGFAALPTLTNGDVAMAQDVDLTPTAEPPTPTAVPTDAPPDEPKEIPEPITVVLFGTGLAALSASAAVRRRKKE